jgi:hypothetical protein
MSRRTTIRDEYRYETVNETTVRYVPPEPTVRYVPPEPLVSHRSPSKCKCTTISKSQRRSPSPTPEPIIKSVISIRRSRTRSPTPQPPATSTVNVRFESNSRPGSRCGSRTDLSSSSLVSTTSNNWNNSYDYKYDYNYKYSFNQEKKQSRREVSLPRTKSLTSIDTKVKTDCKGSRDGLNSLTYVYDYKSDNDDKQITYIKHTTNDSGLSLPGCLIKANTSLAPVNRSTQVGAVFNGNSFGLLSNSYFKCL